MKLVIDISKNVYEFACGYPDTLLSVYAHAIKNGTPLPKGHGRLVDVDLLSTTITEQYPKNYMNEPELSGTAAHFSLRHILQILNSESCVPTIIEADKESIK